MFRLMRLAA